MKLNTNYTNSLSNYVIVNTTEATDFIYDSRPAENIITWLGHSHATLSTEDDNNKFKDYMQYLDAKISAVRKTATFWDAYNIRESVTDKKDFINKYAKLPNNSSLIINSGQFVIGDTTYDRGAVVIKDFYGNQNIIKSKQSGFYIPSQITQIPDSNNLQLSFEYKDTIEQSTINLIIPDTTTSTTDGSFYSEKIRELPYSIILEKDNNNNIIMPFIECYIENNDNTLGDQIFNYVKITRTTEAGKAILKLTADESAPFKFVILVK